MAGFEQSDIIDLPIAQVFAILTDPEYAPRLFKGVIAHLGEQPVGAGATYTEQRRVSGMANAGLTSEVPWTVTVYDPPFRYTVKTDNNGTDLTYSYVLSVAGEAATAIDLSVTLEGRGLRRLLDSMVLGMIERDEREHLAHIRRAMAAIAAQQRPFDPQQESNDDTD